MKVIKCRRIPVVFVCLVSLVIFTTADFAVAGSKTVTAEKLRPGDYSSSYYQFPSQVRSKDGSVVGLWALVKLPPGSKIKKLGHWYWRPSVCTLNLFLYRHRPGNPPEMIMQQLATQTTGQPHDSPAMWEESTDIQPGADRTVLKGYRYSVHVDLNGNCAENAIKVFFK